MDDATSGPGRQFQNGGTDMSKMPRISVVTVNYNMRDGLEQTIQSVISQTYPNLEYIIVDGASTDGSVEVVRKHVEDIDYWVSEKDRNLYDGMNKGVAAATGEWVLFMNSGDCFADSQVAADMFARPVEDADLLYGHVLWRYERQEFEHLMRAETPEILPARMFCSHQSLFARTALLRQYPLDLDLLISDYDFLVRCFSLGKRFRFIDRVVAVITKGGRSDVARLKALSQQQQVLARYGLLTWSRRLKYPFAVTFGSIYLLLRETLPKKLVRWLLARRLK